MDKPPVSLFEQLLKKAGVVVLDVPSPVTIPSKEVVPVWENLIESLISRK